MRLTLIAALLLAGVAACADKSGPLPSLGYQSAMRSRSVARHPALYVLNRDRNVILFNTNTRAVVGSLQPSASSSFYVPVGIALDAGGDAYVGWAYTGSYGGGEVDVYSAGSTKLLTSLSSASQPLTVAVDAQNDLYVGYVGYPSSSASDSVAVYAKGNHTISYSLSNPAGIAPRSIATDALADAYVLYAGSATSQVCRYASGSKDPTYCLRDPRAQAIAVDSKGRLFVADARVRRKRGSVAEYSPTGSLLKRFTTGISNPLTIAVTGRDTLYVGNGVKRSTVLAFKRRSSTPSLTITQGISDPSAIAADEKGRLYVANYSGAHGNTVAVYRRGSPMPAYVLSSQIKKPIALAIH